MQIWQVTWIHSRCCCFTVITVGDFAWTMNPWPLEQCKASSNAWFHSDVNKRQNTMKQKIFNYSCGPSRSLKSKLVGWLDGDMWRHTELKKMSSEKSCKIFRLDLIVDKIRIFKKAFRFKINGLKHVSPLLQILLKHYKCSLW